MAEHTEKQLVYLRQKQGRNTRWERKGVGILPNEEKCSKGVVKSLIRSISSGFPLVNHLALRGSESAFGLTQGPPLWTCAIS